MTIKESEAKIISAESKPYDIDGNKGVSHRIRVLIGTEIFALRATEDQVTRAKDFVGKVGDIELEILSPKENLRAEFGSFVAD